MRLLCPALVGVQPGVVIDDAKNTVLPDISTWRKQISN